MPLGAFGLIALLTSVGTVWAVTRGAHDLFVFWSAWHWVAHLGETMDGTWIDPLRLYRITPDRFLYAPGFAWLFSPLGRLEFSTVVWLWCFAKAAALGYVTRVLIVSYGGLAATLGVLMFARPLLIDFQYGQVNTFLLAAAVAAFANRGSFGAWALFAIAAVTKLLLAPLLVVPWLASHGLEKDARWRERLGVLAGVGTYFALPLVTPRASVSVADWLQLLSSWRVSVLERGFPLETHNQGVLAALYRFLSGMKTHVIALGSQHIPLGSPLLSGETLDLIGIGFTLAMVGLAAGTLLRGPRDHNLDWLGSLLGLTLLGAYLVWKPYFVLAIPLAAGAVRRWLLVYRDIKSRDIKSLNDTRGTIGWGLLMLSFLLVNASGFDLLGHYWAARAEAASTFTLAVGLLFVVRAVVPLASTAVQLDVASSKKSSGRLRRT